jgi:hypothetical protein
MNRDWLPVQLPESQARIKTFRKWMPNVLCMKWEQILPTFPTRRAPLEPIRLLRIKSGAINKIRIPHKALDKIGSSYFVEENYDDFGKGSSLPLTSMV